MEDDQEKDWDALPKRMGGRRKQSKKREREIIIPANINGNDGKADKINRNSNSESNSKTQEMAFNNSNVDNNNDSSSKDNNNSNSNNGNNITTTLPLPPPPTTKTTTTTTTTATNQTNSIDERTKAVTDAVEKRSKMTRYERNTTDFGHDGCDGEFYEYLDHSADVQLHSWGPTLSHAFEQNAIAMFNYITDLSVIEIQEKENRTLEAKGHDMHTLLFNFLDEFLFLFSTEMFVCKKCTITEFNRDNFTIKATAEGDIFDLAKHPQGTEVKAITYSNMQVHEKPDRYDIYVIVDI